MGPHNGYGKTQCCSVSGYKLHVHTRLQVWTIHKFQRSRLGVDMTWFCHLSTCVLKLCPYCSLAEQQHRWIDTANNCLACIVRGSALDDHRRPMDYNQDIIVSICLLFKLRWWTVTKFHQLFSKSRNHLYVSVPRNKRTPTRLGSLSSAANYGPSG